MKFRTVRNGYDPEEVEQYFKRVRETYDETLVSQRDRIFELKDALVKAENALAEYDGKKERISAAIDSALSKADEIERLTRRKVAKELAALRKFHRRWVGYYARMLEKYPVDDDLEKAGEIDAEISRLLGEADEVPADGLRSDDFDPVGMIEEHLAADGAEDGTDFDYDAAAHPSENLGQILRDLGLMFGDDEK